MTQTAVVAGIDCGKDSLDLAVVPGKERYHTTNTPSGHRDLIAWLVARGVSTVGIEASGGYERPVRDALIAAGLTVHVLDPARFRQSQGAAGQDRRDRCRHDRPLHRPTRRHSGQAGR